MNKPATILTVLVASATVLGCGVGGIAPNFNTHPAPSGQSQASQGQSSAVGNSATTVADSNSGSSKPSSNVHSSNSIDSTAATAKPALGKSSATSGSTSALAEMENDLAGQETSFTVDFPNSTNSGTISATFTAALSHEPYVNHIISTYQWSWQGTAVTFRVKYLESKQQTAYVDNYVKGVLNRIVQGNMTDFEKEKVIHDWIVQHVQYDESEKNFTAYDALTTGRAVCQGYSLLAYRMLTDAGIPTDFVTGTAEGQSHLWNEVYIDGNWYQLDVTFDDPVGDSPSAVSYAYFNLTNRQLAANHVWNTAKYPVANTDFDTNLKDLVQSDPSHASQYESILTAIGGNLEIIATPSDLASLLSQTFSTRAGSLAVRLQCSTSSVPSFVQQAIAKSRSTVAVSTQYSYVEDARYGSSYSDVNFAFTYR